MDNKDILSREFTTPELARILGVSTRKVISMLERGYFEPSIQDADGHASKRLYSFNDVVRAYIIHQCLEFGLSVDKGRVITTLLKNCLDEPFFMINKYGEPCVTSDDPKEADKNRIDFINNPTTFDSEEGLDTSPVFYIPVKVMRVIVYKKIEKLL